jgi:phosphohistidine phosphatase
MGTWLKKQRLVPDTVVSSPAARARQTAEAACQQMGLKEKKIVWDERVYAASASQLLEVLKGYKKKPASLMLVGHNPGLEDLLVFLVGGTVEVPPDGKLLPTAAVAAIELPDRWEPLAEGCGRLRSVTRVKEID